MRSQTHFIHGVRGGLSLLTMALGAGLLLVSTCRPVPEVADLVDPETVPKPIAAAPASVLPCEDKLCGDSCKVCPPDDPSCADTVPIVGYCHVDRTCSAQPPACISSDDEGRAALLR